MMKKEYVKPSLVVEEILLESMVATSVGGSPIDPDAPGLEGDPNEASARRGAWGDFWN